MSDSESSRGQDPLTVAFVGNPNCGKSTLFNVLTGERQKEGNFPGVTVGKTTGRFFSAHGKEIRAIDLPGSYSLSPNAPDEQVTYDFLHGSQDGEKIPDVVLCVVDASALERHIPLVTEVADLGIPVVVALNMVDRAEKAGVRLNPDLLSQRLGLVVVPCQANKGKGAVELKHAIENASPAPSPRPWDSGADENEEETLVKARFAFAKEVCQSAAPRAKQGKLPVTDQLDRIFLHPILGWVLFGSAMFLTFWALFSWAEAPMGWIEEGFASLGDWVGGMMAPGDFRSLIVDGVIAGIGGVLVFLPQIIILFFLIGLLESSGYMARAAYLMDGPMSAAGLTGRSFIPLLSSYACAIPGIMGTRSIDAPRGRLITILIAPWMSCTARLPVYTLMIALIFSGGAWYTKPLILFALYALGTLTALVVARLLRAKIGKDENAHFLLELPPYHAPRWGYVFRHTGERAWAFVRKAGTVILGLSILIWAASTYPKVEGVDGESQIEKTVMGQAGKIIEPIVAPLGYDWRIGVGVLTSFAAREVFNSTMAITFSVEDDEDTELIRDRAKAATWPDGRPLFTPLTCISLLIFYIYALQCLPTTAVVQRETGSWKIAIGQFVGMSVFAYLAALAVFQVGKLLGYS